MTDEPIILSIDTATPGGSTCLTRGNVELAARTGNPEISQSNTLLDDINETLNQAGVSLGEVELFACASGPGSFTGLRIGIATVKALAATLRRPVIGIPTLKAIAFAAGPSTATVAALPAGRGEVFAQMFSIGRDGTVTELDEPAHLSPVRLVEKYGASPGTSLLWAGTGAHTQQQTLRNYAKEHGIEFADAENDDSSATWRLAVKIDNLARHVASLALQEYRAGRVESAQSLSAIYVRPSDAELKQQCS